MNTRYRYYPGNGNSPASVEFELRIPGGIYPVTTCSVDVKGFLGGRRCFPCGSGDDHTLTDDQAKTVGNLIRANAEEMADA